MSDDAETPVEYTSPGLLPCGMASGFRHALKNSLGSLKLTLRAVARASASLPPSTRAIVEAAQRELPVTEVLVDRFLSLLRPAKLSLAAHGVAGLLQSALDRAREATGQAGEGVSIPDEATGLTVVGDAAALEEAFAEVLANALEVDPAPELVVESVREGRLLVEVHDRGPGLSVRLAGTACQPFVTTKPDRAGLGLAVARRTFEAHAGALELVQGDPGVIAVIRLPLVGPAG